MHRIPYNDHQHSYHTFNGGSADDRRGLGRGRRRSDISLRGMMSEVQRFLADCGWGGIRSWGFIPGRRELFPSRWPIDPVAESGSEEASGYGARIVSRGRRRDRG